MEQKIGLVQPSGKVGFEEQFKQAERDFDLLNTERASILRPLRCERRDVQRDGNDTPHRAGPGLLQR